MADVSTCGNISHTILLCRFYLRFNFTDDKQKDLLEMPKAKKWRRNLNLNIMYQLNFPNGNVQTYASEGELRNAARLLGGEAKMISSKVYAFVPKK